MSRARVERLKRLVVSEEVEKVDTKQVADVLLRVISKISEPFYASDYQVEYDKGYAKALEVVSRELESLGVLKERVEGFGKGRELD